MATKRDALPLTKRQVRNLRADLMKQAKQICNRLCMAAIGLPVKQTCQCGEEYEVYESVKMDNSQVAAAKTILNKVFPDVSAEDFESATNEPKSKEEIYESVATLLRDRALIESVTEAYPDTLTTLDVIVNRPDPPNTGGITVQ